MQHLYRMRNPDISSGKLIIVPGTFIKKCITQTTILAALIKLPFNGTEKDRL
jgi:hypothetical protein